MHKNSVVEDMYATDVLCDVGGECGDGCAAVFCCPLIKCVVVNEVYVLCLWSGHGVAAGCQGLPDIDFAPTHAAFVEPTDGAAVVDAVETVVVELDASLAGIGERVP